MSSVEYLGWQYSVADRSITPQRMQGLRDMGVPETKAQLVSGLALFNWFRDFMKRFAELAAPLYKMRIHPNTEQSGSLAGKDENRLPR